MGGTRRSFAKESQMRWRGPEKLISQPGKLANRNELCLKYRLRRHRESETLQGLPLPLDQPDG